MLTGGAAAIAVVALALLVAFSLGHDSSKAEASPASAVVAATYPVATNNADLTRELEASTKWSTEELDLFRNDLVTLMTLTAQVTVPSAEDSARSTQGLEMVQTLTYGQLAEVRSFFPDDISLWRSSIGQFHPENNDGNVQAGGFNCSAPTSSSTGGAAIPVSFSTSSTAGAPDVIHAPVQSGTLVDPIGFSPCQVLDLGAILGSVFGDVVGNTSAGLSDISYGTGLALYSANAIAEIAKGIADGACQEVILGESVGLACAATNTIYWATKILYDLWNFCGAQHVASYVDAIWAGMQHVNDDLTNIEGKSDTLITNVGLVQTSVNGVQTSVNNVQTSVNGVQTSVNNVQTSVNNVQATADIINANTNTIISQGTQALNTLIDAALKTNSAYPSLYMPQAKGGQGEYIKAYLQTLITNAASVGANTASANAFYQAGVQAFNAKNYKAAFNLWSTSYNMLVTATS